MKWKVSSVWEPSTSFPATLKESKHSIIRGHSTRIKGISDKATIPVLVLASYNCLLTSLLASAAKQVLVN